MMTWSNEKVLQLIAEYEAKPVLWDSKDWNYKNKVKRILAWEEIANRLKVSRLEAEHKFRILLVQYRRERSKIMRMLAAGHDLAELEAKSWYAYKKFSFLQLKARNHIAWNKFHIDNANNFNEYEGNKVEPISDECDTMSKDNSVSDECDAMFKDNTMEDILESTMEEIHNTENEHSSYRIVAKADTSNDELFVSYMASEMKNLKCPRIRRGLKRNILKALLQACEEDDTAV